MVRSVVDVVGGGHDRLKPFCGDDVDSLYLVFKQDDAVFILIVMLLRGFYGMGSM